MEDEGRVDRMRGTKSDEFIDLVESSPGVWEPESYVKARAVRMTFLKLGCLGAVWALVIAVLTTTNFK